MRLALGVAMFATVAVGAGSSVHAEPALGLKKVGGGLGFVDPEGAGATIGLGPKAVLGMLVDDLQWSVELGYWSKGNDGVSVSDLSLMSSVDYHFPLSPKISPFAGGGLSVHFFNSKVDAGFGGKASESQTELGFHLEAGSLYAVSDKWEAFGLLRLLFSEVDQTQLLFGGLYRY